MANFTAQWCGPCQAIKPLVDQMYDNPDYSKVEVVRVDLDTQQLLAARYSITSIPTFLFFNHGEVVEKVSGATPKIQEEFQKLNEKAKGDTSAGDRAGNGTSSAPKPNDASVPVLKEITKYVPKGYNVLNDTVYGGDFEALNTLPLNKTSSVKDVFDLSNPESTVFSDADSQMLLYVPLTHISKVYSVLIKTSTPENVSDSHNLDADDLDEIQRPNLIKIWGNKLNILSFDDAASDTNPSHQETLDLKEDGWYECRLKYVRFQNVQGLNIFIDGDDDDSHTVVEKIVIIGIGGEEKDHHNMMDKLVGEEH